MVREAPRNSGGGQAGGRRVDAGDRKSNTSELQSPCNLVCRLLLEKKNTSGHVMIVPFAHVDELQKLSADAVHEMIELTQRMEGVLRQLYATDGVNLGMNIGKAAGAGVASHVHMHILPRWIGDTNFMTVAGESRVLPESLEITYERIKGAMDHN